ncbi:MAG: phosphodiester glycosidase family protein [Erysipelotrichaceae bacterium]|nr:phosphodiester glycosidase family protein [Erysipelotrichaceae bacterium]
MSENNMVNTSENTAVNETLPSEEKKEFNKKPRRKVSLLTKLLLVIDIIALVCFYVVYGPVESIREWYIMTAINTGKHKYLAYIFYDNNTIGEVINRNRVMYSGETTNPDLINIVDNPNTGVYANAYDREILEHDPDQKYKVITIDEDGMYGWLTVIYQPKNLRLVVTNTTQGEYITEFADRFNSDVVINGGGFYLTSNYTRYNMGSIILDGQVFKDTGEVENQIAMDYDGRLLLLNADINEVAKHNVKWSLFFYPFFIVNGIKTQYGPGSNPGGLEPRTAIGQRADGIVILMTIDGRGGNGSRGANFRQMTEIFDRYSCINAANLDGGGSSMLAINHKLVNAPISYQGAGERYIYNAIILE